jgi:uroporphyrinogen-III synthase
MTRPLEGKTIALAESRQLEELAQMLEQEGASTLRCPMLSILDNPDAEPVLAWLRELTAGRLDLLVLMTGEALRRLLGFAERAGMRDAVVAALAQTPAITRGPKPVKALKEIGLSPYKVAQTPTTEGVIATLRTETLCGKRVGVTRYAEVNEVLENFLTVARANLRPVTPYVYAPAADDARVVDLIERLARGEVAVLVFTSSPQIDRLYEVAEKRGLQQKLTEGLGRVQVAAVGPVVAENLHQRQAPVHICPEQGFVMKNLVQHIKRALPQA